MDSTFELRLHSTGASVPSFVDADGVFHFVIPDCAEPQRFDVVVRVPSIRTAYAVLSVHGERGDLTFPGISDGLRGSVVTIREHRGEFLAFAPTRIDNEVEIDGDGVQQLKLGEIDAEIQEQYDTVSVPSQTARYSNFAQTSSLPTSLKLPEKHKKAMLNAVSIVGAGRVPAQAPSNSPFVNQALIRSLGITLRGFYSTAMGHFLRKKLPLNLVHLAVPARRERAGREEVDDDDDDAAAASNAPNKRRLLSSATPKRPKSEPKAADTQVKPEPGLAAASSSTQAPPTFKVLEDGVLDLT